MTVATLVERASHDRRDADRRHRAAAIEHADWRGREQRGYLDRRADPNWSRRWLKARVVATLRDAA